jgi:hypothetical protein
MVCSEDRIQPFLDRRRLEVLLDLFWAGYRRGLSGAYILALAIEMSLGSGKGFWEVVGDRFCGEARPRDELIFF